MLNPRLKHQITVLLVGFLSVAQAWGRKCDLLNQLQGERISSEFRYYECENYLVAEHIVYTRLHCLDYCNLNLDCVSVNYKKTKDGKLRCLLLSESISGLIQKHCLLTLGYAGITTEVVVEGWQEDVTKINFSKDRRCIRWTSKNK